VLPAASSSAAAAVAARPQPATKPSSDEVSCQQAINTLRTGAGRGGADAQAFGRRGGWLRRLRAGAGQINY
jgi:hypothetical protein